MHGKKSLMHPQILTWASSGNVFVKASQESTEIDNHINTEIPENSDDSFYLSQTESETDYEEIQNNTISLSHHEQ